eukprot:CAMPEP_0197888078 /NCGR_PEP_ID=MMETSP1439-20131203/20980_1 /TAXON_ID=66791 /ORGANISM="Gonyaulax spinifera, Strain CCMP409" /LENGTH=87 /DNA_ID=CAMNT_0043507967 /DNA_START=79 /DNA_END=342 /DNA_ORIENTATION=+
MPAPPERQSGWKTLSMLLPDQALQPTQAYLGSLALSRSMACISAPEAAAGAAAAAGLASFSEAVLARRILSTSTVNLMASAAALVRR